jgi:hypothetical protein
VRGWNEFGPDIPNEDLTPKDVPAPDAPYWQAIEMFALTFDGYADGGFDRCAQTGNAASAAYAASGDLPQTLTDLRTCLFFEQRRWRHFEADPDPASLAYIRALLESIRRKVQTNELT